MGNPSLDGGISTLRRLLRTGIGRGARPMGRRSSGKVEKGSMRVSVMQAGKSSWFLSIISRRRRRRAGVRMAVMGSI